MHFDDMWQLDSHDNFKGHIQMASSAVHRDKSFRQASLLYTDPFEILTKKSKLVMQNTGTGGIQLWQFLLELLADNNNNCIMWEGTSGEFKLIDPEQVARKWGARKAKPQMNYDKLSRALRYYYDKSIMKKVQGKRYAYQFNFQGLMAVCQQIKTPTVHDSYVAELSTWHENHISTSPSDSSIPTALFSTCGTYWSSSPTHFPMYTLHNHKQIKFTTFESGS